MVVDMEWPIGANVEFVSYTGKYPCLCMGELTLKINGKTVVFGHNNKCDYPPFWSSGGRCWCGEVECSEWKTYASEIPDIYRELAFDIDRVFNENVPYGCCGGCL